MTCKLYLVPEDVINNWRSEQREKAIDLPVKTVTAQIDSKMSSILKNDMSDYDKEKLYAQELETLRTLRNKKALPSSNKTMASLISSTIPMMYQRKAGGLLDYLKSSEDISWDERGQIRIGDQLLERSHLLDLIHDAVRFRKQAKRPEGWKELSTYLDRSNVPRELVGNPAWIKSTKGAESTDDTIHPDSEFDSYSDSEFQDAEDTLKPTRKKRKKGELPTKKSIEKVKQWHTVKN